VRAVGGLDDTVIDPRESEVDANGIKFHEYSPQALIKAMQKALTLYERPELILEFRLNGMSQDFSWDRTANDYVAVYQRAKLPRATV
jgi:starch synthase